MNIPTAPSMQTQRPRGIPTFVFWIIAMVALLACTAAIYLWVVPGLGLFGAKQSSQEQSGDYVTIRDYAPGAPIVIKQVRLSQPGFVVILSKEALNDGKYIVLGKSRWLPAGRFDNVSIYVTETALNSIAEGASSLVTLYYDDGDQVLYSDKDTMATGPDGNPIGLTIQNK